jgi:hypothetical protein
MKLSLLLLMLPFAVLANVRRDDAPEHRVRHLKSMVGAVSYREWIVYSENCRHL